MKKKLFAITATSVASLALLLATLTPVAISTTGCSILGGGGTNGIPQSTIDATAVLLQGAAAAGAQAAIQQDPKSAEYFSLAADSISTFLTATNYTPGAFQASLMAVVGTNSAALSSPYVQIGIGTVIDLYQLYFGMYVKGQVNGNAYAGEFLTAIQNGFYQALGRPLKAKTKAKLSEGGLLLPRPLKKK